MRKAEINCSLQEQDEFYKDVIDGLSQTKKRLPSKYFYDAKGDLLFQDIMRCPEYYLTRCEKEIFQNQTSELIRSLFKSKQRVQLVELGAGDGSKTHYLIKALLAENYSFTYRPIDISMHVLEQLTTDLSQAMPALSIDPFQGDYFEGLKQMQDVEDSPKVVLFLGANIGNMPKEDAQQFCKKLRSYLNKGDRMLIGFDLIKNPRIVQAAYDDAGGLTWQFNMNLLHRMNSELHADFNVELFEHYCQYDPVSGACSSYLVSILEHTVHFPEEEIHFTKGELIHTEVSQKYHFAEIEMLAKAHRFRPLKALQDSRGWFVDVVWEAI